MRWPRLLSLVLTLVVLPLDCVSAAPPPGARNALRTWKKVVLTGNWAKIAAQIPEGTTVRFRTDGYPRDERSRSLGRAQVFAALKAGQADQLGLDKLLLLPRLVDARKRGRSWEFTDRRCPEVTWIFQKDGARWRLVEVVRTLLGC